MGALRAMRLGWRAHPGKCSKAIDQGAEKLPPESARLDKTIGLMRLTNIHGMHWQVQGAALLCASSRARAAMAERA